MKNEILTDLLGNVSLVNYLVGFIFVVIAIIFKWCYKTIDSIKNNPKTPAKWDWNYWVENNLVPKLLSLLMNIIAVFIVFRFSNEILGVAFSYILSLVVGLALDYYIDKIKKMIPEK